jgi:hypothetical protein
VRHHLEPMLKVAECHHRARYTILFLVGILLPAKVQSRAFEESSFACFLRDSVFGVVKSKIQNVSSSHMETSRIP